MTGKRITAANTLFKREEGQLSRPNVPQWTLLDYCKIIVYNTINYTIYLCTCRGIEVLKICYY